MSRATSTSLSSLMETHSTRWRPLDDPAATAAAAGAAVADAGAAALWTPVNAAATTALAAAARPLPVAKPFPMPAAWLVAPELLSALSCWCGWGWDEWYWWCCCCCCKRGKGGADKYKLPGCTHRLRSHSCTYTMCNTCMHA